MKKGILVSALALSLATVGSAAASAAGDGRGMWAEFHGDKTAGAGIGFAENITGNIWGEVRMDSLGAEDVSASFDALYLVPEKLMFLEFYGGLGLDYSLGYKELGGHVIAGTQFWHFFSEAEYRLVDRENIVRAGIRIKF